ncbi:MAG: CxxC-x17-CxxC domain-containing protein [Patescibacteria group bacterium]|jgi:CxxC-x17-CxxC domain-containing protein|nr:CxxC-x17-CxxC domain-containing protein [Patescibacteria group bacterium]
MGRFNRNDKPGGRRDFGDRKNDKPMYKAICNNCGKNCEVPFKPSGDRPVLCSDCFSNSRGNDRPKHYDRSGNKNFGRDKTMYIATCDNCGDKCEVPFRPTGDKPVYCNKCFNQINDSNRGRNENETTKQLNTQLTTLNNKLDKILEILSQKSAVETKSTAKPKKATIKEKKVSTTSKKKTTATKKKK